MIGDGDGGALGTAVSGLVGTLLALAFVLLLAWGALKLLRAWQDRNLAAGQGVADPMALRFVRALPVGPRERVMLIEAEGDRLLIGVAAGQVSLLARWPRRAPDAAVRDAGVPDEPA